MHPEEYLRMFPDYNTEQLPFLDFLQLVSDYRFVEFLKNISNGIAMGFEYNGFDLPETYESWEEEHFEDGVRFYNSDGVNYNEVIVDYKKFYEYLYIACNDYIYRHPDDKDKVKTYLTSIKERYKIEIL